MESMPELELSEFSKALTKGRILTFRLIAVALFLGVTAFLGIILFFYFAEWGNEGSNASPVLPLLTIVHFAMAVPLYILAFVMSRFLTSKRIFMKVLASTQLNLPQAEDTPEARFCVCLFNAFIIRMAMLEGVTLFGLVNCLVGVMTHEINDFPIGWVNLFSYGVFVLVFLWTFPTRSKLEAVFRARFMSDDDVLRASL